MDTTIQNVLSHSLFSLSAL